MKMFKFLFCHEDVDAEDEYTAKIIFEEEYGHGVHRILDVYEVEPIISRGDITYIVDGYTVKQICLPDEADNDPHPRLLFDGYGIHSGHTFTAFFPNGWHSITLEVSWEKTGPYCWYISTKGFRDVCPVGLWCRVN